LGKEGDASPSSFFLGTRRYFWCLTQIKDDTASFAQIILHAKGGTPMSPYLMQAPVLGALAAAAMFAAILLFCSITDARQGKSE
jgi:hypothetical protein